MAKEIQIAPDEDDIKVEGRKVTVTFNGLDIEVNMHMPYGPESTVKACVRMAIAFSSRSHHIYNNLSDAIECDVVVYDSETKEELYHSW